MCKLFSSKVVRQRIVMAVDGSIALARSSEPSKFEMTMRPTCNG
jgi:hypothetical protein